MTENYLNHLSEFAPPPRRGPVARPHPPEQLCQPFGSRFEPAPDLHAFLQQAFLREGAPLYREEYEHLSEARIGVLWTNVERVKDGLFTLGMAQLYRASGDKWTSGRAAQQIAEWFCDWWPDADESVPDFILTFYAPYVADANHSSACALFSHELRHCGQKRDLYDMPAFHPVTGAPLFAIQGHDVEEFVSVIEDFGIEAAGPMAQKFVGAAQQPPRFAAAQLAGVCGCGAKIMAAA